jgi:hypothetical protein
MRSLIALVVLMALLVLPLAERAHVGGERLDLLAELR